MYACVYVCARTNINQISVISPVEAQAQMELIIHTVTLLTGALILPSLLSACFHGQRALGGRILRSSKRVSDQAY